MATHKMIFLIFMCISILTATSNKLIASEVPIILKEAPKPDLEVFTIAARILNEYKEYARKAWGVNVIITLDELNGVLYTNWHRVHKGEAEWQIQIMIWGHLYRIDVWERSSLGFFRNPRKGYMCRLEEMRLQDRFDKLSAK